MTALTQYSRIESTALWRPTPEDQRREVIVSIGDATLVITNINDQALTHWSLAAVMRANPGVVPAIFYPDGDPGETLEFANDEIEMLEAIEKLRVSIARRRPHKGRLRLGVLAISVLTIIALGVFWLPNALLTHTLSIVPAVKRVEIGDNLLRHIETMTGSQCDNPAGLASLNRLSTRLFGPDGSDQLTVVPSSLQETLHLPGQRIVIGRPLTEDPEEPAVLAGYILAEASRMATEDPLKAVLQYAGLIETFQFLTTGALGDESLRAFAEFTVTTPQSEVPKDDLLSRFKDAKVQSSPYAYALDISGEKSMSLIELDPFGQVSIPAVLTDADWVSVQNICGY